MKKLLREPLFHFLFFGFLLFLWFDQCSPKAMTVGDKTIVVTKDDLLTMMQFQSKAFQPQHFEKRYAALSAKEKKNLIDDYVREEVLYRRAKQLNLDDNDYIIKRRMMQKVDFIMENNLPADYEISEDKLQDYYERNKTDYAIPTLYTFTHVYFKVEDGNEQFASTEAEQFLANANRGNIAFNDATKYGDRFLYNQNYVEKDLNYVQSHFGESFSHDLANQKNLNIWSGPYQSDHGYHVIKLSEIKEGGIQDYQSLKEQIKIDYDRELRKSGKEQLLRELLEEYEVKIAI